MEFDMQRLLGTLTLSLAMGLPTSATASSDALIAVGVILAGIAITQPQTYPQGQPPVVVGQSYPQTYPQVVQSVRTQVCVWQPFYDPRTGQPLGGRTNCYWQR